MKAVQCNLRASAGILDDGSVVTWGAADASGGGGSDVCSREDGGDADIRRCRT